MENVDNMPEYVGKVKRGVSSGKETKENAGNQKD